MCLPRKFPRALPGSATEPRERPIAWRVQRRRRPRKPRRGRRFQAGDLLVPVGEAIAQGRNLPRLQARGGQREAQAVVFPGTVGDSFRGRSRAEIEEQWFESGRGSEGAVVGQPRLAGADLLQVARKDRHVGTGDQGVLQGDPRPIQIAELGLKGGLVVPGLEVRGILRRQPSQDVQRLRFPAIARHLQRTLEGGAPAAGSVRGGDEENHGHGKPCDRYRLHRARPGPDHVKNAEKWQFNLVSVRHGEVPPAGVTWGPGHGTRAFGGEHLGPGQIAASSIKGRARFRRWRASPRSGPWKWLRSQSFRK